MVDSPCAHNTCAQGLGNVRHGQKSAVVTKELNVCVDFLHLREYALHEQRTLALNSSCCHNSFVFISYLSYCLIRRQFFRLNFSKHNYRTNHSPRCSRAGIFPSAAYCGTAQRRTNDHLSYSSRRTSQEERRKFQAHSRLSYCLQATHTGATG